MSWKIDYNTLEILKKGSDAQGISKDEALTLLRLKSHSPEVYALMHTAWELSRRFFGPKGERHFHIGLNIEPCPLNCKFCSLAKNAGIFNESVEFSSEQILAWVDEAEKNNADAINIMTTGTYSFERFLELGKELSARTKVPLVANTRDVSPKEADALLASGFKGFYHALRLGEGRDTPLSPQVRKRTIRNVVDAGLKWMNCIEPVGPEHPLEEIVELMFLARENRATYSGVMRRINFPGSPLSMHGMITEWEMARMTAVSRLVMGDVPKAHCVHEPNTIALMAGANLFFPEVGSSPRDNQNDTREGRGSGFEICSRIMEEMELDPNLVSNCF